MSTETDAARKAWHDRNSDFRNSWTEDGRSLESTHAPPAISEVAYDADTDAFAGLIFPLGRITPDAAGESAEVIRHEHSFDPTLEDPDA